MSCSKPREFATLTLTLRLVLFLLSFPAFLWKEEARRESNRIEWDGIACTLGARPSLVALHHGFRERKTESSKERAGSGSPGPVVIPPKQRTRLRHGYRVLPEKVHLPCGRGLGIDGWHPPRLAVALMV